jgi:large subunit ribosomal protein L19
MESVIQKIEAKHKKKAVVNVKSGDTVRVHQEVIEGSKKRVQIFEGLVIKVGRRDSLTATFTVRRIASGVGVEKTFLLHVPSVLKVEIVRRSKVRRNYLTYMRERTGKRARLSSVEFDREAVNAVHDEKAEAKEEELKEETAKAAGEEAAKKESEAAKLEAKAEKALAQHDENKSDADKLEEQPKEKRMPKALPRNKIKINKFIRPATTKSVFADFLYT